MKKVYPIVVAKGISELSPAEAAKVLQRFKATRDPEYVTDVLTVLTDFHDKESDWWKATMKEVGPIPI